MTRILYVHHYYPALLFSNMISGIFIIPFLVYFYFNWNSILLLLGLILDYVLETISHKYSGKMYPYIVAFMIFSFSYW